MLDFTIKQNPRAQESPHCRNSARVTEMMCNIYTDFYQNTAEMALAC